MASKLFGGWGYITNLADHYNGRVWVTWRPDWFKVTLISSNPQAITCEVENVALQREFIFTIVHAFNTREERRSLWSYLEEVNAGINIPWLIMGDFNALLKMEDRLGGNPISLVEVADFQNCVERCGLLEMIQKGSRYSWSDRHGDNRILSKLDWVFVNTDWLNSMPDYYANFMPEGINDHCPVKLMILNGPSRK
ncbi:hypothetical protein KY290_010707 [Solanum tuberosum]|uniref:Endonuclease/exonuclease/phosphatase domain-containing protein n=1 Tax=Solanum tuberosum TaxID=4113 RepID=A0ABQ7VZ27_SOLTU|nr:hypothetical protein KY290_010707 [Solanum tuberosum]